MTPRQYRLGKRAEAVEDTRRRIVEATFEVHAEKGIAATTFRDIADRADVSVATVYRHFPTYDDVVLACGALAADRLPPLDAGVFDGLDSVRDRVAALVRAVSARSEIFSLDALRGDAPKVPVLQGFVDEAVAELQQFVRVALPEADDAAVATVVAVLEGCVHRSLREQGQSPESAVVDLIATWLEHRRPAGSGGRKH